MRDLTYVRIASGREASRAELSDAILSLGSIRFVEVRLNESPPGAQQVYSSGETILWRNFT